MSDLDEVARLLHSKTMEGKIQWRLDGDRRVSTTQGDTFLEIDRIPSGIRLTLRNRDGIALATEEFSYGGELFKAMHEVMTKVKRDTLGVDRALGALKESLSQL